MTQLIPARGRKPAMPPTAAPTATTQLIPARGRKLGLIRAIGCAIVDTTYPREGTETLRRIGRSSRVPTQLIPARGRKLTSSP